MNAVYTELYTIHFASFNKSAYTDMWKNDVMQLISASCMYLETYLFSSNNTDQ